MKRINLYAMLFCGIFLFSNMASKADNAKLSAFSRQQLDRLNREETRLKANRQSPLLQLLLQCNPTTTGDDLQAAGAQSHVSLGGGFFTVQIGQNDLSRLLEQDFVERAELSQKASLSLDQARTETHVAEVQNGESLSLPYTGKGVVLGFVDSGFDVTHPAFRATENDTLRIARFWNQIDDKFLQDAESILAEGTDNEEQTHGTHVAAIAGGGYFGAINTSATETLNRNPYYGVAYDADMVMVGSTLEDADILNGIKYIFNYADSINKPAVVNISLNTSYGPHDGTSLFDQAIDAIVGKGKILVGSIGNDAKNKAHASMELSDESTPILTFFKPTGYESNTFEVWGQTDGFSVTVSLLNSQGESVWNCTADGTDQTFSVPDDYNYSEGGEVACYTELWNGTRRMYRIALNNFNLKGYDIQVGVTGTPQHIDLWTDKNSGQFTNNNKSTHVNFDTDYTLGELGGTGRRTISVGNYTTRNVWTNYAGNKQSMLIDYPLNKINYTSSCGPTPDGRVKPDVTAPGGMIFSAVSSYSDYYKESSTNTVASATIDGKTYFWGQMTGTSQASPFVAGVIATWLEADNELTPEDIQLILKKTARADSYTGSCPNSVYGYGKIDALAGIKEVISPSAIATVETAEKPYRLHRDGILFTSPSGLTRIVIATPDGIIRYNATTEIIPGSSIEWQELGLNSGLYILRIGSHTEKVLVH